MDFSTTPIYFNDKLTYLNWLIDEKEETTETDSIIQEIVLQDENTKQLFQELNTHVTLSKQEIAKTIMDFIQTVTKKNELLDAKKESDDTQSDINLYMYILYVMVYHFLLIFYPNPILIVVSSCSTTHFYT